MDYKQRLLCILLCISFILTACDKSKEIGLRLLTEAEILIETSPDSALLLLDSVPYPKILDDEAYHNYILLKTRAKDKCYKSIVDDTLIYESKNYFLGKNDLRKQVLASLYSGRVQHENKLLKDAMISYLETEKRAEHLDEDAIKGLIQSLVGELYYHQEVFEESISRYKKATKYFNNAGEHRNEVLSLNMVGCSFFSKDEKDSANIYYNQALELAGIYNLPEDQVDIRINMANLLRRKGDFDTAKSDLRQAIPYVSDSAKYSIIYYNLATIFREQQNNDSTSYYANEALGFLNDNDEKNSALLSKIYSLLSVTEENRNNYKHALTEERNSSKYLRSYQLMNMDQAILDVQKKYNFELVQNANNKLVIQQQQNVVIILVLALGVIIAMFLYYRKSTINKKERLEGEQKIYQLKELARKYEDENTENKVTFRNVLLKQFDIMKKAALVDGYLRDDEKKQNEKLLRKFNEIVYGKEGLDWNLLYQSMNELHNKFFDHLRNAYPQLDESEFRICCLSYANFSNTEIGMIMKLSLNTIQTRKTIIRRKVGIKGYGNMNDYFNEKLGII
ncbi:tetratricopeptide repeat protein [Dysgonomonas sp. 520]|uniref:tetratricopeptide repeat protein n=1 Tax=Dysgonomonas sp. 520 TaxID=2302931 RepID=UPI0013D11DA4|nr:tetratricopeptide repeat protein [Dysgonomonas sp. 520]NDW09507.1 hypothetical protein [Dysgonomonas sp. 520]